jgi:hypothetical protein
MRLRPLALASLALVLAAPLALPAADAPTPAPIADPFANPHLRASSSPLYNARVDGIDADGGNLSITDCPQGDTGGKAVCEGTAFSLKVDDPGLRTKALKFHLGDHIRIAFGPDNQVKQISGTAFASVPWGYRLLALSLAAGLLYLFTAIAIGANPLKLIVGMDNRYSNSKLQVAVWFWILISTYLATLFFRVFEGGMDFIGAIAIPQNLLLLSGMSAISFSSAKAITQAKVNAAVNAASMATNPAANAAQQASAAAAPVASLDPKKAKHKGEEDLLRDLVMNDDGVFDFGDFQMVVVTILAVCTYLLTIYHYLAVIHFTILAAFGLGQGAYLAKKAAGNVGGS